MVFLKLYWGLLSIVFFSLYIKSFILLQRRKSLGFHPVNKVANATHQDGCSDIYTITRHPDTLLMVSNTLPVQCGGAPSCMNGYPRVFIPRAHLSTSLKTSALTGDAKKICLIISDPQKNCPNYDLLWKWWSYVENSEFEVPRTDNSVRSLNPETRNWLHTRTISPCGLIYQYRGVPIYHWQNPVALR